VQKKKLLSRRRNTTRIRKLVKAIVVRIQIRIINQKCVRFNFDDLEKRKLPGLSHSLSFGPNCNNDDIYDSDDSIYDYKNKRTNATSFIDARRRTGSIRRTTKGHWTKEEDAILRSAVHKYDAKNWKKIAESLIGRTDVQ
jgi:hypothetical protein